MSKERGVNCQDTSSTTWDMDLLSTSPKLLNIVSNLEKELPESLHLQWTTREQKHFSASPYEACLVDDFVSLPKKQQFLQYYAYVLLLTDGMTQASHDPTTSQSTTVVHSKEGFCMATTVAHLLSSMVGPLSSVVC
jgi:hypothetical protein